MNQHQRRCLIDDINRIYNEAIFNIQTKIGKMYYDINTFQKIEYKLFCGSLFLTEADKDSIIKESPSEIRRSLRRIIKNLENNRTAFLDMKDVLAAHDKIINKENAKTKESLTKKAQQLEKDRHQLIREVQYSGAGDDVKEFLKKIPSVEDLIKG